MAEPLSTFIGGKITSTVIINLIVAFFSSAFGALTHTFISSSKGEIRSKAAFARLAFISFFVGIFFTLVVYKYYGQDTVIIAMAGMFGGYIGLEGLAYFTDIAFSIVAKKYGIEEKKENGTS